MNPIIFVVLVAIGLCAGIFTVSALVLMAFIKVYLWIMNKRVAKARAIFSDYEHHSGHQKAKHQDGSTCSSYDACNICDLFLCSICGGVEGSLLPVCPGRKLTPDEHDENYAHYCARTGPFQETSC